jgi:cellulose synthase/poly-beta-1,6-N-acetylglucosamine synthase-like glycosyltransferase
VREAIFILSLLFFAYFIFVNLFYLGLVLISARTVRRYARVRSMTEYEGIFDTTFYKPVTVIVPAHNEEKTIVYTVTSALAVRYPELEVVAVNDGSTDGTLDALIEAFDLIPSPEVVDCDIPCSRIRGLYESPTHPGLRVIDKEQGGKADALNAGINASSFPLVCNIDADSIVDVQAMVQITRPFLEDHQVVAVGGVVMPANSCDIEGGMVKKVRLSRCSLVRFQVVEYLRAFLYGRVGWSCINSLMIISGAFAVFRRTALVEVGGYSTDTVGEDMELVLRMHRVFCDKNIDYRILFLPDPICWTQVPEDRGSLSRQRRRWQQGLAESLVKNRHLCVNPRYGGVGLVGYPFFVLCELLSPAIELAGYVIVIIAIIIHAIDWQFATCFLICAMLLGTGLSMSALVLESMAFGKYVKSREVVLLTVYALLESFGFRQLHSFWRCKGLFSFVCGRGNVWGQAARKAF